MAARNPPDLDAILAAFADAHALVAVSLIAVREHDQSGPESITLRMGVEAIDRAYNMLDRAIVQLGNARKATEASS